MTSLPPLHPFEARICTEAFSFVACSFLSKSSVKEVRSRSHGEFQQSLEGFRNIFQEALASVVDSSGRAVSRHGSEGCVGIIDTGASKSVIGQSRVRALVESLPEASRSRVARRPSSTVFRFGNNGTLKSPEALYLPFGSRWMKVEVVSGATPFLISNAFLFALKATLDVARSELVIPAWSTAFHLQRNEKGLLTVNLLDVIAEADRKEGVIARPSQEVISMACTPEEPSLGDVPSMHGAHETHTTCQLEEQQLTAAAKVAQNTPSNIGTSTTWTTSLPRHGGLWQPEESGRDRAADRGGHDTTHSSVGRTLQGEVDPEMDVPKIKTLEELPGHPPGVNSLRD